MIETRYDDMQWGRRADLLEFGVDRHLRLRWFVPASMGHPAKLNLCLLGWVIDKYTRPGDTIADPMAGTGSILIAATHGRNVIAREIEPRWLDILQLNADSIAAKAGFFPGSIDIGQADACEPWGYSANHIIMSPPYGNEVGTTASARRMLPYKFHEGLIPYSERWQAFMKKTAGGTQGIVSFHYGTHPAQVGHFRGRRYWLAMESIYRQAAISLRPGGFLILVIKDHIANGKRVETSRSTVALCQRLGFCLHEWHQRRVFPLSLWQRRRKEKELPVVEEEDVLVFQYHSISQARRDGGGGGADYGQ